jgi:hypothetical protein
MMTMVSIALGGLPLPPECHMGNNDRLEDLDDRGISKVACIKIVGICVPPASCPTPGIAKYL